MPEHRHQPSLYRRAGIFSIVRASLNLKLTTKYKALDLSVAAVFSQVRAIGVTLGFADPEKPNKSMTLWRTAENQGAKVFYFESVMSPAA